MTLSSIQHVYRKHFLAASRAFILSSEILFTQITSKRANNEGRLTYRQIDTLNDYIQKEKDLLGCIFQLGKRSASSRHYYNGSSERRTDASLSLRLVRFLNLIVVSAAEFTYFRMNKCIMGSELLKEKVVQRSSC